MSGIFYFAKHQNAPYLIAIYSKYACGERVSFSLWWILTNLLMMTSIQRNITKDYPIAKPLKYLTTRSHHPLPQKGEQAFSAPEQASYCWVFGCSCMVFLSDGLSMSARETIFDRVSPMYRGVTWSSWSKLDSWWEYITCERCGRPSGTTKPLNKHIKIPLQEDKMSS